MELIPNELDLDDISQIYLTEITDVTFSNPLVEGDFFLLMENASLGNVEKVSSILDKDPNLVNRSTWRGSTALMATVGGTNFERSSRNRNVITRMLLNRGANVHARDEMNWTALMLAAKSGDVEVVKLLIDFNANIDAHNLEGDSSVQLSGRLGHKDIFTMLLSHGASVDICNLSGQNVFHIICAEGQKFCLIEALRFPQCKRLINTKDVNGRTPLHLALMEGHLEVAYLLLSYGAYVTTLDKDLRNALHICCLEMIEVNELATIEAYMSLAEMLVDRGCDVRQRDSFGESAQTVLALLAGTLLMHRQWRREMCLLRVRKAMGVDSGNCHLSAWSVVLAYC